MDVIFLILFRHYSFCGCCTSVAGEFSLLPGPGPLVLRGSSSHHHSQVCPVLPSGLPHLQWHSPPGKHTCNITPKVTWPQRILVCCPYKTVLPDLSAGVPRHLAAMWCKMTNGPGWTGGVHGTCHTNCHPTSTANGLFYYSYSISVTVLTGLQWL